MVKTSRPSPWSGEERVHKGLSRGSLVVRPVVGGDDDVSADRLSPRSTTLSSRVSRARNRDDGERGHISVYEESSTRFQSPSCPEALVTPGRLCGRNTTRLPESHVGDQRPQDPVLRPRRGSVRCGRFGVGGPLSPVRPGPLPEVSGGRPGTGETGPVVSHGRVSWS